MCDNYNLYKGTASLPYPYTEDAAASWIKNHEENFNSDIIYEFAITDKTTGKLYGSICLTNKKSNQNGELGYWIGEEYWGNGYATEAAKALIEFAFQKKGFHKVFARHYASNPASGKVMEKAGMTYEGTLKEHMYKIDHFEDVVCYGIVCS